MKVGLDQIDSLGGAEVLFHMVLELLHLISNQLDLNIQLFEFWAEIRIDDIVILFCFADIDTLLEHGLEFGELLECALQWIQNLRSDRVLLIHDIILKVLTQTLQSMDHVVNLHTVYKLCVVPQLGLNPVKLGIQFL